MIELLFGFSVAVNILFIWYIVQLLRRFLSFQQELDDFVIRLEEYEGHVDVLYNLERFYGDESLANLLKHSKTIVEDCKHFRTFMLSEDEEFDFEGDEDGEDA